MNSIIEAQIELKEQQELLPSDELEYLFWYGKYLNTTESAIREYQASKEARERESRRETIKDIR